MLGMILVGGMKVINKGKMNCVDWLGLGIPTRAESRTWLYCAVMLTDCCYLIYTMNLQTGCTHL